jgi:hypothetical protein
LLRVNPSLFLALPSLPVLILVIKVLLPHKPLKHEVHPNHIKNFGSYLSGKVRKGMTENKGKKKERYLRRTGKQGRSGWCLIHILWICNVQGGGGADTN